MEEKKGQECLSLSLISLCVGKLVKSRAKNLIINNNVCITIDYQL